MAALNDPFWEGISADMRRVMTRLGQQPFTQRFFQPELFENIPWEEIKRFFIQQARLLSAHWFD